MKEKRNAFLRIGSDGEATVTWLKNADANKPLELRWLQSAVGGYIEVVPFTFNPEFVMIVDEEGLLKDYRLNGAASTISGRPLYGAAVPAKVIGEDLFPLTADEAQIFVSSVTLYNFYTDQEMKEEQDDRT